jgi:hypothetical protein
MGEAEVHVRITDRARSDVLAVSAAEYVEICTVVEAFAPEESFVAGASRW